jgi:predicted aspartyl protease
MNIKPKINFFQYLSQKDKIQIQDCQRYLGIIMAGGLLATGYFGLLLPATSQTTSETNKLSAELGKELVGQIRECVQTKLASPPSNQQALQAISMRCLFEVAVLEKNGKVRNDASDRVSALFAATGFKPPQPTSEGRASNVGLRYLPRSRVFTVPVSVGSKTNNFLLDTGASASVISTKSAQQLRLMGVPIPGEVLKYMGVGGNCSTVKADSLRLPTVAVSSAKVSGLNGLGLAANSIPGKTSGVLGLDFLSNFDVVVHPQNLRLQLLQPSQPVETSIPLRGKLGAMTVQVMINGQGPFTFMLDTGADLMVISKPLAQKLKLDNPKAKKTKIQGFCGTEAARKIKLNQVSLQSYKINNLDAVILDNDNIFNMLGVEGIVGQNFLTHYQQHWRFGNKSPLGYPEKGSLTLTPMSK